MKEDKVKKSKKQMIAEKYRHLVSNTIAETPAARGFPECPCPKKCSLHGKCLLCTAYHARKGKLPRCERA